MKTIKRILGMCARSLRLSFALAAATVVAAPVADARIVRLEILTRPITDVRGNVLRNRRHLREDLRQSLRRGRSVGPP